ALNQGVRGDGLGPGIALSGKCPQRDRHFGLRTRDRLVGNANGLIVKCSRAEIGMQSYRRSNEIDDVGRIGIDRSGGYVGVPQTAGRTRNEAVETGALAKTHAAASTAWTTSRAGTTPINR